MKKSLIKILLSNIVILIICTSCSSYITKYYFEPTQGSKINLDLNGRYNYSFEAENLNQTRP